MTLHYRIDGLSLMHAPVLSQHEVRQHRDGARQMAVKYRNERGRFEFYAMKGLSRLVLTPCTTILR
jgi:hypothetical protein